MIRDNINIGTNKYVVDYFNSIDLDIQYYRNFVFIRNYEIFNNIIIDTDIYFIERDFYFTTVRNFLINSIDASEDLIFPIPFSKLTGYSISYNDFNGLYSKNSFYNSIENVYKFFLSEGNKDCGIKDEKFKNWIKTCHDKYIIGKEVYELYDKFGNIAKIKCDKLHIYSPLMVNNIDNILHIDNYINNINFHYFCGILNSLNRNSENIFELNHNTYTEFYEVYIPSANYLFSGDIYFNEDLNIQIAEENKVFLQKISSNSYLTKNLLVLKGYKFEDINIALKDELNNNEETKENIELFYYNVRDEYFKIIGDNGWCWLTGKIFIDTDYNRNNKGDGLPIIEVNPDDINIPDNYNHPDLTEIDKLNLINKYGTQLHFGIFTIDINDTIEGANKEFIEKIEINTDKDDVLYYKIKNILLLSIYDDKEVYNDERINNLFVYNKKHDYEGLEAITEYRDDILYNKDTFVYHSSNRKFEIYKDNSNEPIFKGTIIGLSDYDGSPIIESDSSEYNINDINQYGAELHFGDITLDIYDHFHNRKFEFDYLFDILSLKSLTQPFKIVEREVDGELLNMKQYIKENNSVHSNYMNIPLGVSLFPYSELSNETNLYILDDKYDTHEISFVNHCEMSLSSKLGFNDNNILSVCCKFNYKNLNNFKSFKEAYFYYNDVKESEYDNYKESMLENLRTNIEEIYGLTDPEQIDNYIETYKEEILEEYGVSFDFIGMYVCLYTDTKMQNAIWNKKIILDIKDLSDTIDIPLDMSDIFSDWKQLPDKLICNIKFFDQYLGNIIYGNVVIITKEWFKYVINDTNFNIFNIIDANGKNIKNINDNMKTISLSEDNINFINNITCNIIKNSGDKSVENHNRGGLNSPRLLYKPYFYKVQDLQKISLRTGLKQNIGISLVEYMTKVTLFKLVINNNEYKEIGRNDVYVIFGIDAMDINTNTGKYDIFNQDDEYISSGEFNLY